MPDDYFECIRQKLADLPRADNHVPGASVDPDSVFTPSSHRSTLDLDRVLIVGNRGMGKSFWTHALLNQEIRKRVATDYNQPGLHETIAVIGFNASERMDPIAPPPNILMEAVNQGIDPESIWRAVLARAVVQSIPTVAIGMEIPDKLAELARWVDSNAERYGRFLTSADEHLQKVRKNKLLIIFDALDRLGPDWTSTRKLTGGLLRRALAVKSYRAIRFKLFMRPDQFSDPALFTFPDASKIKSDRVDLKWSAPELYGLLFHHLKRTLPHEHVTRLFPDHVSSAQLSLFGSRHLDTAKQKQVVNSFAGEFMGASKTRGAVYSWLPLHLADALDETSPRTFLTAWREAANHCNSNGRSGLAVDYHGINDGVRKASADRVNELKEDYPWIRTVLEPLRDDFVPMEQEHLKNLWINQGTVKKLRQGEAREPLLLISQEDSGESALIKTLQTIGVIEVRSNGKVNIPDIFRVEAGVKRKGGVKPPKRG